MTEKLQNYINEQEYLRKIIKTSLEEYPNPFDIFGNNPLQYELSPLNGYKITKEKIRFFLENGVDINHQNKGGYTALMTAVKTYSFEIVEYLIEKGADRSLIGLNGKSVFDYIEERKEYRKKSIEELDRDLE